MSWDSTNPSGPVDRPTHGGSLGPLKNDLPSEERGKTERLEAEWLHHGVLVYGPRKAGTTLLLNLHDGGQELVVYPAELKIKRFLREGWNSRTEAAAGYLDHSQLWWQQLPNFDADGYRRCLESGALERANGLWQMIQAQIHGMYLNISPGRPENPKRWVVKEVGGDTEQIINFWKHLCYDSRVVMIIRDPKMITRSVIRDRKRKGIRLSLFGIMRQVIDPLRVMSRQRSFLGIPSFFFITYEELTHDPQSTMRRVCEFLNVAYEPVFVRPTIFGEPVVTKTASRDTTAVFVSDRRWYHDLSLREILAVGVFSVLATWILRLNGEKIVPYDKLRKAVQDERSRNDFSANGKATKGRTDGGKRE